MNPTHAEPLPGGSPPYFEESNKRREVAYWASATQVQIERWEPLVADQVSAGINGVPPSGDVLWRCSMERHFVLIAADHLLTAMNFVQFPVHVDPALASEIHGGRDLLEHWKENMPIFNVTPRPAEPKHESGKRFSAANPRSGPYFGSAWDNQVGPKLLPNVPADEVRQLIVKVKHQLTEDFDGWSEFFHDWEPLPWIGGDDVNARWFPQT